MSPLQIAVCCLAVVGVVVGKPTFLHVGVAPVSYAHVGVAPVSVSSQYHAQDALGQYSYGYSGGPSAKVETKTVDGVTRGGYSYVDANGVVQSANYVADDAHGFSVAASNLPQHSPVAVEDTPEVAAAKAAHAAAYSEAAAAAEAAPDVEVSEESDEASVAEDAVPVVSSYSVSSAQQIPVQYAAVSPVLQEAVPSKAFSYSTVAVSPAVAPVSYSVSQDVSPVVVSSPHVVSYNAVPGVSVASAVQGVAVSDNVSPVVVSSPHVVSYNAVPSVAVSENVSPVVVSSPHVVSYNAVPGVSIANAVQGVAVAHTVPVGVVGTHSHQYHAQDALGQYSYGYVGGPSAKTEAKSLDGIVRGGYSYIDANGLVQTASYVADDVHGFRVAATNVPVAPEPVVAEA